MPGPRRSRPTRWCTGARASPSGAWASSTSRPVAAPTPRSSIPTCSMRSRRRSGWGTRSRCWRARPRARLRASTCCGSDVRAGRWIAAVVALGLIASCTDDGSADGDAASTSTSAGAEATSTTSPYVWQVDEDDAGLTIDTGAFLVHVATDEGLQLRATDPDGNLVVGDANGLQIVRDGRTQPIRET